LEVLPAALSEDAAPAADAPNKNGKRQRVWKDFNLRYFGEFSDKLKSYATPSRHFCARSVPKSLPFSFLHRNFYFSLSIRRKRAVSTSYASVAIGLRQAVCKTVAVSALEVRIFPDA
jgi:hypothetical protein